jgi:hypothetical protein
MGRRSRLLPEIVEKICEAISIGSTNRIAGLYAGVAESTIFGWLKTAREELERRENGEPANRKLAKYVEFLRKYEESEATAFIGWLTVIDNAAQTNPQWASYMLERRDRAYAARSGLDVTSNGGPITFKVVYENKRGTPDNPS